MATILPPVVNELNYLSVVKYAVGAIITEEMTGATFTCSPEQEAAGTCLFATGEQALSIYSLSVNYINYMIALAVCLVVYRLVAYSVLAIKTR